MAVSWATKYAQCQEQGNFIYSASKLAEMVTRKATFLLDDLEQSCNTFRQSRRHRKSPKSTFEIILYTKHLTFGVLLKCSHQWVDKAALRDQLGRGRSPCDRALTCCLQRVMMPDETSRSMPIIWTVIWSTFLEQGGTGMRVVRKTKTPEN